MWTFLFYYLNLTLVKNCGLPSTLLVDRPLFIDPLFIFIFGLPSI